MLARAYERFGTPHRQSDGVGALWATFEGTPLPAHGLNQLGTAARGYDVDGFVAVRAYDDGGQARFEVRYADTVGMAHFIGLLASDAS